MEPTVLLFITKGICAASVDQHAAQHFLHPRAVLSEQAEKERGESSVQETGWLEGEVGSGLTVMLLCWACSHNAAPELFSKGAC